MIDQHNCNIEELYSQWIKYAIGAIEVYAKSLDKNFKCNPESFSKISSVTDFYGNWIYVHVDGDHWQGFDKIEDAFVAIRKVFAITKHKEVHMETREEWLARAE